MSAAELHPKTDRWQRYRAARLLAGHARDAEELIELLDMLGLTANEGRNPPKPGDGDPPAPGPPPAVVAEQRRRLISTLFTAFTSAAR
jgi:hypothetical protein